MSMHQQLRTQLANLPIDIIFITNGQLGLSTRGEFPALFDSDSNGNIIATITPEKLIVKGKEIKYNTAIRLEDNPELKEWLVSLDLECPWMNY